MVSLNEKQQKALAEFIEFCNVPRLRKTLVSKVFSEIIKNAGAYNKKEAEDIVMLYILLEGIQLES